MKELAILIAFSLLAAGCAGQQGAQSASPSGTGAASLPGADSQQPPAPPGSSQQPPASPSGGLQDPGPQAPPVSKVSAAQLSAHASESDCYVAYRGKVYDISSYIPKHKNGQMLLVPLCGTSGKFESAFTSKHGTSKVEVLLQQGVYKGELVQ